MKNLLMFTVIMAMFAASQVSAVEIGTVSIADWSSNYVDREPDYIINGAGLNINGTGTHSWAAVDFAMWLSAANSRPNNQYIIFDLGDNFTLSDIKVWNYNNNTGYGVGKMTVLVSTNGSNWTSLGDVNVPAAPINDTTQFGSLLGKSTSTPVRYVQFDIFSNGYGVSDGTSSGYVGLSEVKFYGTSVNNQTPIVDAGFGQAVKLGQAAALDGTVEDDGLPNPPAHVTLTWSKVSGPGTVTFVNTGIADTNATFSAVGEYILQLTANDSVKSASDTVHVKVLPADYRQLSTDLMEGTESRKLAVWGGGEELLRGNAWLDIRWTSNDMYGVPSSILALTRTNIWCTDSPVGQYATIDLGLKYDLNYIRIWNQSDPGYETTYGVANIEVMVSDTNTLPASGQMFTLVAQPTDGKDNSQIFAVNDSAYPNGVRYIRVKIASLLGGPYAGIAELRFSGTLKPANCGDVLNAGYTLPFDFNGDCRVDFADLETCVAEWLRCTDPTVAGCEKPWL